SIATWAPYLTPPLPARSHFDFDAVLEVHEGWDKTNRHYWQTNWQDYAEFFFGELLSEPHSTKQWEDSVGWAMEIAPDTMIAHDEGPCVSTCREDTEAVLRRVRCPVLTIHGDADRCQPHARGEIVAEMTGGEHLALAGVGHLPQAREPVVVNRAIRD